MREFEKIIRFEQLLSSYANLRNFPRECVYMDATEEMLLTLTDRSIDQKYPDYVLVALAGALGEAIILYSSIKMIPCGPSGREIRKSFNIRGKAIKDAADWLVSTSRWKWIRFWKPQSERETFNKQCAVVRLSAMFDEHLPPRLKSALR